ncbi:MAG: DNA primase small subunit PriS [Candidatus Helarchaeota archaeon]|nr:DNA primase small subunit PriS [Candidatus Helarchaeota archaeon]
MNKKELNRRKFLTQMFKNYYNTKFNKVNCPSDIEHREFGFVFWDYDKFVRHVGFINFEDLANHINSQIPRHIYSSAARYETPNAHNMKLKEYIDCELIFDLDIDHIPTPCKKEHDKWICKSCGASDTGTAPIICPSKKCDSKSFQEETWECEKCMGIAKSEIFFIIEDFLSKDFGLNPKKDLFIVFSGRRGYHIHIENESLRTLDSNARREIVDYVTGKGLVPSYHGLNPKAQKKPSIYESGWRGRIARLVLKLLEESSMDEIQKILTKSVNIESARREIIFQLNSKNPSWSFERIGEKLWHKLIQTAVKKYSGKVDEPVTIDIHRLIRLPGSLHGKTGFLVKKLSLKELEKFDPFSHTQVFQGTKKIRVKEVPQFRIGEETFGKYKDEYVELPMSAAILLLCKDLATL